MSKAYSYSPPAMFADLGQTHFTSQTPTFFLHRSGELGQEQSLEMI